MKAIDWSKIYKKYKGLWVALLDDQQTVIGSGDSIERALAEARRKGYDDPIVMSVPAEIIPFVGASGFRS